MKRYTRGMLELVVGFLSRILVPMFIVGMAGSTLVVAITFLHDVIEFSADDDANSTAGHAS